MKSLRTFFFALLLAVLVVMPAIADPYLKNAKSDPFYGEILKAEKTKTPREMIEFLNEKLSERPARIHPASIWLRDNSVGQRDIAKVDALYFLQYSDVMYAMAHGHKKNMGQYAMYTELMKTALAMMYVYELMATIDAARCEDRSVRGPVYTNTLMTRLEALKSFYRELPKKDFDSFTMFALKLEDKVSSRKPNEFICSIGMAQMMDLEKQKGVKHKKIPDPNYPGRTLTQVIAPKGYKYEPKYVSADKWAAERNKIRETLPKGWEKRFMTLSKAEPVKDKK